MLRAFTSSHNMDTKTNLQFRICMLSRPNMVLTVLFRTEHDKQGNSNNHDWNKEGMLNRWFSCMLQLHYWQTSVSGPCGICGGESGTRPGFFFLSEHFSFPCQYHSTNAPYSFIHLPPTLYNIFLPALQFPLSVSFHQRSTHSFISSSAI